MRLHIGLWACILSPSICGILTHSKTFPVVIEISGNQGNTTTGLISDGRSTSIAIGKHEFTCTKRDEQPEDEINEVSESVTRIHALAGVCWNVGVDTGRKRFFKVCIGEDIKDYKLRSDGSPGIMKLIATTDRIHNSTMHPWGIEEWFEGPDLKVQVKYQCARAGDKYMTVVESASKFELEIPTMLVCSSLSYEERMLTVATLPRLGKQSDDRFWVYSFAYPEEVMQVHIDRTGATPEEKFSLGNRSDGTLHVRTENSLNSDNPYITKYLEMKVMDGTMCSKHNIPRQTVVRFRCPLDWEEVVTATDITWTEYTVPNLSMDKKFKARLSSVNEPDLCEYLFDIETTALCVDPEFVPKEFEVVPSVVACSIK